MNIVLYSSHCPRCNVLERLMNQKGIKYELVDDEEIYLPIAESNGIKIMPFALIDEEIVDSKELQKIINNI